MRAWGVLVGGLVLIVAGIALLALVGVIDRDYETNGERIYFTGRNDRGQRIAFSGTPFEGARAGSLSCASCHSGDAEGGRHRMHMLVMDAPDIRWFTLAGEAGEDEHGEYDLASFRLAVVEGRHPDGEPLSDLMPRWQLSDGDLADLAEFLQSFD